MGEGGGQGLVGKVRSDFFYVSKFNKKKLFFWWVEGGGMAGGS